MPPKKRQLLGERYELGEVIGHGGMAEVHRGRDVRLGRDVAIKLLRADLSRDPAFEGRFRREAQSAAALNSPSIVAVYDTGEADIKGAPTPYIVMEYIDGRTLREVLAAEGHLLPQRALEITAAVCLALEQAHAAGIVHRDIKPANVMVTPSGEVKVMDFGIARALTTSAATMTQTAAVVGTAHYLSPEQARGEHVDSRSDVYSTGCLLYELLTGAPPFSGESAVAVAYQHVREDPTPPSMVEPDVPTSVDAIVLVAMAKNPANRYATAALMRADIERAMSGQAVHAVPVVRGDDTIVPTMPPTTVLVREPHHPGRWLAYFLLTAATVGVFVVALIAGRSLLSHTSAEIYTPNVTHQSLQAAEASLRSQGLAVGVITHEFTNKNNVGDVVGQSPPSGSLYRQGQAVALTVSSGVHIVTVPANLIGDSQGGAISAITSAGLRVGKITFKNSSAPSKQVLDVDPASGTQVPANSKVALTVSRPRVKVPDVTLHKPSIAESILRSHGFKFDLHTTSSFSAQNAGLIVTQTPAAGTLLTSGKTVIIYVESAPPPPPPPPSSPPAGPSTGTSAPAGPTNTAKPPT
jgi:beta-lactam-binding protein with PASTA domain/predicted Ser/Thr protein kinase